MTGEHEFSPESWERSAQRITEDGETFASSCATKLSGMTTGALNCDGYGTMMDAAFAMIFPASVEAFQETAEGLGRGFGMLGDAMNAVGASYRGTEIDNENLAGEVGD